MKSYYIVSLRELVLSYIIHITVPKSVNDDSADGQRENTTEKQDAEHELLGNLWSVHVKAEKQKIFLHLTFLRFW